jgi:cytochrome c oxidase cbb3-type subunit 3
MLTSVASIIVTIVVLASIIGCGFILWNQSRIKLPKGKVETTGHAWDGLEEYNNPLPKWWMYLFWITVIFSLAYVFLYPALGNNKGMLDWSSTGQWQKEINKADEQYGPLFAKYAQTPVQDLAQDPQAIEVGKRLYLTYCYQCHGSDARGAKGFPNLTDGDWLYGGQPETILQTITQGRNGMMPPHAHLGEESIKDLANYVRSLSGLANDSLRAAKGKELFASSGCAGCHGPDGKGNQAIGAPNLTDNVWLYGSQRPLPKQY